MTSLPDVVAYMRFDNGLADFRELGGLQCLFAEELVDLAGMIG